LNLADAEAGKARLVTTVDGHTWRDLTGPPSDGEGIVHLVAPDARSPDWIAVTQDDEGEYSTIWRSRDLEHWTDAPFPMPTVEEIVRTPYGLLALGIDECRDMGACDADPSQYFVSPDGRGWTPLGASVVSDTFVASGAGVIGIGRAESGKDPSPVWRLEPYTADEARLFDGLRADAKFDCAARRVDLPAHAVAGVECAPKGDLVERIGVYGFTSADDLLDTYLARLASSGVKPRSGSCREGVGEDAYVPGDHGATLSPYRNGCYLNEHGVANFRYTEPDALVYVGILGTGKDVVALDKWAWRGNQDQPGSPTVWRGVDR